MGVKTHDTSKPLLWTSIDLNESWTNWLGNLALLLYRSGELSAETRAFKETSTHAAFVHHCFC